MHDIVVPECMGSNAYFWSLSVQWSLGQNGIGKVHLTTNALHWIALGFSNLWQMWPINVGVLATCTCVIGHYWALMYPCTCALASFPPVGCWLGNHSQDAKAICKLSHATSSVHDTKLSYFNCSYKLLCVALSSPIICYTAWFLRNNIHDQYSWHTCTEGWASLLIGFDRCASVFGMVLMSSSTPYTCAPDQICCVELATNSCVKYTLWLTCRYGNLQLMNSLVPRPCGGSWWMKLNLWNA